VKTLKYLVIAGAMLLGTANSVAQTIPEFRRDFLADTKIAIASANGPIQWSGRTYKAHNSPVKTIYEIRGYINVPIKVFGIGSRKSVFHLGAITRIDGETIESIIYVNNRTDETLTEYDRMIAKKEGINLEGISSLWHEKYTPTTITNLETGEVRQRNGAAEFQTIYFNLPEGNLDTLVNVNFCGDTYPINITVKGNVLSADLTIPDPEKPGERKKLQKPLFSISAHKDEYGLPDKMVAGAEVLGITFHPEATYEPTIPWKERR
jgi:hypothetical protein